MNQLPCLISNMSAYVFISVDFYPHPKILYKRFPMFTNASTFYEAVQYASTNNVFLLSMNWFFQLDKVPIQLPLIFSLYCWAQLSQKSTSHWKSNLSEIKGQNSKYNRTLPLKYLETWKNNFLNYAATLSLTSVFSQPKLQTQLWQILTFTFASSMLMTWSRSGLAAFALPISK